LRKLEWGGEGETVYLINSAENLQKLLKKTVEFETSGQAGFLMQECISSGKSNPRVVVNG